MQPALDEVQQAVNKAAQLVIGVSKGVSQWSKERKRHSQSAMNRSSSGLDVSVDRRGSMVSVAASEASRGAETGRSRGRNEADTTDSGYTVHAQPKNYFKSVYDNKEISKIVALLSTSINSNKKVRFVSS